MPLVLASQMGLPGVMRALLLSDGEGRNQQLRTNHLRDAGSEGWTALHWAVWNGHRSRINDAVMELLLQQGHDDYGGDKKTAFYIFKTKEA